MDWSGSRPSAGMGKLEKLIVYFEKAPGASQAQENITQRNKELSFSLNNGLSPILSYIIFIATM